MEGPPRRRRGVAGDATPRGRVRSVLALAGRMAERGEPFALATVVRRTPPSSARPGARALVTPDGEMRGWLGGSCLDPVVRREAADVLEAGEPRLLVFAPDPDAEDRPGASVHPMTCHSGGSVEIHVEPVLPEPTLELYGDSPVVGALAEMAPAAGFRVRVEERPPGGADDAGAAAAGPETPASPGRGPGESRADLWAVVATMGEWDDEAVRRALEGGPAYVGLVASPRRAEELRRRLGLEDDGRLVSPAGLDLGAREPGEIAVTILAEVIRLRRADAADGEPRPAGAEGAARDPVCGMEVRAERARHRATHEGEEYVFCCARCRETFVEDPGSVLSSAG